MKARAILLALVLLIASFAGCAQQPNTPAPSPTPNSNTPETSPDVVTTASIVDNEAAFEKALGSDGGTWIICTLKDLSFEKELVLEGEYTNGKKDDNGKDVIQRKIALYEQDENRNVTAKYTLTAPKLTINSPEARIQSGTFKGDLHVSSKNFQLVDTIVEGNVYFTNEEAQNTFKMDDASSITGKQELQK